MVNNFFNAEYQGIRLTDLPTGVLITTNATEALELEAVEASALFELLQKRVSCSMWIVTHYDCCMSIVASMCSNCETVSDQHNGSNCKFCAAYISEWISASFYVVKTKDGYYGVYDNYGIRWGDWFRSKVEADVYIKESRPQYFWEGLSALKVSYKANPLQKEGEL